ncbi:hypothetical protein DNTS_015187 [Danionella cerebrum]|uniref:GDNF/GAS1 domain-containing protein n=1 Tax=Danionella cerebrum TaxID=2873325 RepID=A0A553NJI8_9TELE|nr:hypothetical protein DNTS_015187 [Danionella translucida]
MTPHSVSSCLNDDYQACLTSYTRLIGTEMTPNYIDSGHSNFTISPWCTCKGSGNQEEDCEKFLQDFKENTCLRNAIQAFGYGSLPKPDPQPTTSSVKPDSELTAIVLKTTLEPAEEPCTRSSCDQLNELDCYPSNDCDNEELKIPKPVPGSQLNTRVEDPGNSSPGSKTLVEMLILSLSLALTKLSLLFCINTKHSDAYLKYCCIHGNKTLQNEQTAKKQIIDT